MIFAEFVFDPKWLFDGGALAVLVWVVYYTQSTTIPNILANFRQDQAAQRSEFLATINYLSNKFSTEIAFERAHCTEELTRADHRNKSYQQALLSHAEFSLLTPKVPDSKREPA